MKQILTIAFTLAASVVFAQNEIDNTIQRAMFPDTIGVMITLDKVIYLDYKNDLEIIRVEKIKRRNRDHQQHVFHTFRGEVLALHLFDNDTNVTRSISTIFMADNDRGFFYVNSADNLLYSPSEYGPLIITVSEPLFNFKDFAKADSIIQSTGLGIHEKTCKEIEDDYLKETGLIFRYR